VEGSLTVLLTPAQLLVFYHTLTLHGILRLYATAPPSRTACSGLSGLSNSIHPGSACTDYITVLSVYISAVYLLSCPYSGYWIVCLELECVCSVETMVETRVARGESRDR